MYCFTYFISSKWALIVAEFEILRVLSRHGNCFHNFDFTTLIISLVTVELQRDVKNLSRKQKILKPTLTQQFQGRCLVTFIISRNAYFKNTF